MVKVKKEKRQFSNLKKNKKGVTSFSGMVFLFVIIMVIFVLAQVQNGVDTTTVDSTINSLDWDKINQNITSNMATASEGKPLYIKVIIGIASKSVDLAGYTVVEVSKLAMQVARDNPDIINFKVLWALVLLMLIAPIIYPLFVLTISIFIIIKEGIKSYKEKRRLKKMERALREKLKQQKLDRLIKDNSTKGGGQ